MECAKDRAKKIAQGKVTVDLESEEDQNVRAMAYAYEEALGRYNHRLTLKYIKGKIDRNCRSYAQFKKAAEIADQLKVSFELYVRAQFYWFDGWFNRAPKPWEMAGIKSKFPAPERVRSYLEKVDNGELVDQLVVGYARRQKSNPIKVDKINEQKLVQLCAAWGLSEEEALMRFARPGVEHFDQTWLQKHPTYQRLRKNKLL